MKENSSAKSRPPFMRISFGTKVICMLAGNLTEDVPRYARFFQDFSRAVWTPLMTGQDSALRLVLFVDFERHESKSSFIVITFK